MSATQITEQSLQLFLAYAKDAANWGGTPLVGGNVGGGREARGNLTQLKRAGLECLVNKLRVLERERRPLAQDV